MCLVIKQARDDVIIESHLTNEKYTYVHAWSLKGSNSIAFRSVHCMIRFIAFHAYNSAFDPLMHITLCLPRCQLTLFPLQPSLLSLFVYTFCFCPPYFSHSIRHFTHCETPWLPAVKTFTATAFCTKSWSRKWGWAHHMWGVLHTSRQPLRSMLICFFFVLRTGIFTDRNRGSSRKILKLDAAVRKEAKKGLEILLVVHLCCSLWMAVSWLLNWRSLVDVGEDHILVFKQCSC